MHFVILFIIFTFRYTLARMLITATSAIYATADLLPRLWRASLPPRARSTFQQIYYRPPAKHYVAFNMDNIDMKISCALMMPA